MKKKHILIIAIVLAAIGGGIWWWYRNKKGGLNLPPGVDERAWLDSYHYNFNNFMDEPEGSDLYKNINQKSQDRGESYRVTSHREAVYMANNQFNTNVNYREWQGNA